MKDEKKNKLTAVQMDQLIIHLKAEVEKYKSKTEKYEKEFDKRNIKKLKKTIDSLNKEKDNLQKRLRIQEEEQQQINKQYSSQMNDLKLQFESLLKEKEDIVAMLKETNAALIKEMDEQSNKLKKYKINQTALQKEIDKLKKNNESIHNEDSLYQKVQSYQQELEQIKEQELELNQTIKQLQSQLSENEDHYKREIEELNKQKNELEASFTHQIEEYKQENKKLSEEVDYLRQKLNKQEQELEELTLNNTELSYHQNKKNDDTSPKTFQFSYESIMQKSMYSNIGIQTQANKQTTDFNKEFQNSKNTSCKLPLNVSTSSSNLKDSSVSTVPPVLRPSYNGNFLKFNSFSSVNSTVDPFKHLRN